MIGFELTEEHNMVRDMVRRFARKEAAPHIPEDDKNQTFNRELLTKMGELGILGIPFPEKYGGSHMDYISLALACEELEYVDTALRVVLSVHIGLSGCCLYQWGTEEQKEQFLVQQATGKKIGTYALTEPNAGSDPANLQTTAKLEGDTYYLNGEKMWISLADVADQFIIFANTDKSLGHKGITAFIVERDFPGISTGTIHDKLGVRAGNTGSISMDNCEVPKENVLGHTDEGFKIAMAGLDNGRFTVGAGAVGLAKAAYDESVSYAKTREAFNQKIGNFQLIQRMLAHMVRGIDAAELLIWKAGWMKNQGIRNTRETALAKWHATNIAQQCADDAIQIHGAYGYSAEYPVERFWRNARGSRIYEGSDQIQELLQGQYAMKTRQDRPLRCELPPYTPLEE
ncbi:MAG: acyl-CoA dehydrogenase family protein [Candidatus Kariarchaeaceae archaeon]